jgi:general secretion pathway protein L
VTAKQLVQSSFTSCQRFLQWWIGELANCLPRSWSAGGRWGSSAFVMIPTEEALVVGRDRGDGSIDILQRFALRDGKPLSLTRSADVRSAFSSTTSITLRLPAEFGLRKTIRLPLAALENLREAVSFQLDHHTPFSSEEAYFDCKLLQRDDAAGQLIIEATVVARKIVDRARTAAETLGWHIAAVEITAATATNTNTRLFVPNLRRKSHSQMVLNGAAALLLIGLIALAAVFPLARTQMQERQLAQRLDAARHQAETAAKLDKQNQNLQREANFLATRAAAHPSALTVWLELTKLTPDDTWLEAAQYSGNDIEFSGVSSSASAFIGRLGQSGIFKNMGFRSPVTSDPRTGRERFQISGQLQPPATKP